MTSDLQLKSHHQVVLPPLTNLPVQLSLHMGTPGKHLGKLSCLPVLTPASNFCLFVVLRSPFFSRIRHGACHHPWEVCGDLLKSLSPVTFTSFLNFLQKQARTVDLIVTQTVNWNCIPDTVARILNTFWQYLVMSELFKPRDLTQLSCAWPKDTCRHQRSS